MSKKRDTSPEAQRAWAKMQIQRLGIQNGDVVLIQGHSELRGKVADRLEEALQGRTVTIINAPDGFTLTQLSEEQMRELGWVRAEVRA